MPIHIGRRFKNPVLLPQNRGMAEIANRKIEQTVGQANRATQEAINTNGHLVRIWRRQRGAIRCTCNQSFQLTTPIDHGREALAGDPDWAGDTSLKNFERSESKQPLGHGPLGSFVLRDSSLPYDDNQLPDYPDPAGEVNEGSQVDFTGEEYEYTDPDYEDTDEDELQMRQIGSLQRHILGVQKFRCPICFGTSYTDSYNFASGHRYILDASGYHDFELDQASINLNSVPHQFELSGPEDNVTWTMQFPTFFETVAVVRILDIFDNARGLTIEFKEANTEDAWQAMTIVALNSLRGNSKTLLVRVRPESAQLDDKLTFTHVEIVYETTKLPRAQIPQLNRANTLFTPEDIISVECEVDPKVGFIRKESVLEVISQASLWKVGNITNRQTVNRQLFGYQMEITLVQQSEQISRIKIGDPDQLRTVNANFAGLENVQGRGTAPIR